MEGLGEVLVEVLVELLADGLLDDDGKVLVDGRADVDDDVEALGEVFERKLLR